MHQWTPPVTARSELCEMLRDQYPDRAASAGIKTADLDTVITTGRISRDADATQKEQLAAIGVDRSERKERAADLFTREGLMRERLPAVISDLRESGEARPAAYLTALSFSRYRFRELAPEKTEPAQPFASETENEDVRRVMRVEREDVATRAGALAAFCRALCKPGNEPIITGLADRGLSKEWLTQLADDAEAIERAGRNLPRAAEATAKEAEAVAAQKAKWTAIRRMVRSAVRGVPQLEAKFAEC